jgi:hypothetical protein
MSGELDDKVNVAEIARAAGELADRVQTKRGSLITWQQSD